MGGNPASTLNPSDGYWGIGLGHLYKIQDTWDIATGLYYLKFQKPEVATSDSLTPQIAGLSAVSDNSAWIAGLKLGYHFKLLIIKHKKTSRSSFFYIVRI